MDDENIQDWYEYHTKKLNEMPQDFLKESVEYLKNIFIKEGSAQSILDAYNQDNEKWWVGSHFYWGMSIRNSLREGGFLDDKLPDKNWDDYYIPVVELAVGIRKANQM